MVGHSKNPDRVQAAEMEVLEQAQLMARAIRAAQSPSIENRLRGAMRSQYERLYGDLRADRTRTTARDRERIDQSRDLQQVQEQRDDLGRNAFASGVAGAPMGSDATSQAASLAEAMRPQIVDGVVAPQDGPPTEGASSQARIQEAEELRAPVKDAPSWVDIVERASGLALGRTGVIPSVRLDHQLQTATEQAIQFELFRKLTRLPESLDHETRGVVFIANAALVYVILCTTKINEKEGLAGEGAGAEQEEQKQPLQYGRSVLVRHEGQEILDFDPTTMYSSDAGALAI